MGLEPISQPMPVVVNNLPQTIVDVLSSSTNTIQTSSLLPGTTAAIAAALNANPATVIGAPAINNLSNELLVAQQVALASQQPPAKQLKTEYKPEQLASLLQAATSQPLAMASITPASVGQPQQQPQLLLTNSQLPAGLTNQPPLSIVSSGVNGGTAAILSPNTVGGIQLQPGTALPMLPGLIGGLTTSGTTSGTSLVSPSTTIAATANFYRQTLQQQQQTAQLQQNSNSTFPLIQNSSASLLQNGKC